MRVHAHFKGNVHESAKPARIGSRCSPTALIPLREPPAKPNRSHVPLVPWLPSVGSSSSLSDGTELHVLIVGIRLIPLAARVLVQTLHAREPRRLGGPAVGIERLHRHKHTVMP